MHTIFLNIGSNLGDRRRNLSRAVAALEKEFGYFELSHTVESAPWGFDSPNPFLNVGMMVNSDLSPIEVLHRIQGVEKSLSPEPHRNPDGSYADRLVDIDIVAVDEEVIDSEELTVPHPHLADRRFFLEPLQELAPFWRHPVFNKTASEMLAVLSE